MAGRALLIRRSGEGTLSLGILWLLAIPIFVVGYASIVWPLGYLLPHDCFRADCPTANLASLVPPFLLPSAAALATGAVLALALRVAVVRWPAPGWRIVTVVGVVLVASAAIAVFLTRAWEIALVAFVWPAFPGIAFVNAAWRFRQNRRAS